MSVHEVNAAALRPILCEVGCSDRPWHRISLIGLLYKSSDCAEAWERQGLADRQHRRRWSMMGVELGNSVGQRPFDVGQSDLLLTGPGHVEVGFNLKRVESLLRG